MKDSVKNGTQKGDNGQVSPERKPPLHRGLEVKHDHDAGCPGQIQPNRRTQEAKWTHMFISIKTKGGYGCRENEAECESPQKTLKKERAYVHSGDDDQLQGEQGNGKKGIPSGWRQTENAGRQELTPKSNRVSASLFPSRRRLCQPAAHAEGRE